MTDNQFTQAELDFMKARFSELITDYTETLEFAKDATLYHEQKSDFGTAEEFFKQIPRLEKEIKKLSDIQRKVKRQRSSSDSNMDVNYGYYSVGYDDGYTTAAEDIDEIESNHESEVQDMYTTGYKNGYKDALKDTPSSYATHKEAWIAVCETIEEFIPDFLSKSGTGIENAVKAIRSLGEKSTMSYLNGYKQAQKDVVDSPSEVTLKDVYKNGYNPRRF